MAMIGSAMFWRLSLNPNIPIIRAVMVLQIFEPMITQILFWKESIPAPTNHNTMSVTTELLWSVAVVSIHESIPFSGLAVRLRSIFFMYLLHIFFMLV
jgi:hypothetical protein